MATQQNDSSSFVALTRNSIIIALGWTMLCFLSVYWNVISEKEKSIALAQKEAMTIFEKDQAFRFWANDHQGVYVPVTEKTPPNENLKHIPERDIVTPSGKQLTLMNPAYILRQVMSQYATLYSATGHITSLKPINPSNKPDDWETLALHEFNAGKKEVISVEGEGDTQSLRFMKPMYTKAGCLECHSHQGYELGDVRGGVSISIPLAPYRAIELKSLKKLYLTHLFFFFSGISVIVFSYFRSRARIIEQFNVTQTLHEHSEKTKLFAYFVAHDLKNPAIAIHGLTKLLKKKYRDVLNDEANHFCDKITQSASQIESLVEQINIYISAKEHPLKIQELNFLKICQSINEEYASLLEQRTIEWSTPTQNTTIRADRIAIMRIIRNLIDNALKYGGDSLSHIEIAFTETEYFYTFSVSNNGNAIQPEKCHELFSRFTRNCNDDNVTGVGLGLTIVKELVSLHGGEVWGKSDGNQGVTFSFTISKKL